MKSKYIILLFFSLSVILIFYRSLSVYFVQDDFYYFQIIKNIHFWKISTFLIPRFDAVWYRPLSAQVFFYIFKLIFGLNPLPYHLLVLVTQTISGIVIYLLINFLFKNKLTGILTGIFYITNQIHTVSLSWLATYTFILAPLLVGFSIYYYFKEDTVKSLLYYFLGILAFETVVILPIVYMVYELLVLKKIRIFKFTAFFIAAAILLYLRFIAFPTQIRTSLYSFALSNEFISNFRFYLFRLIGIPMSVDQMSPVLKILSVTVSVVLLIINTFGIYKVVSCKKIDQRLFLFIISGMVFLVPFLLMPNHLAPYYLSLTLLGIAPVMGITTYNAVSFLPVKLHKITLMAIVILYLGLQFIGSDYTYKTHWIFKRANLARDLVKQSRLVQPIGSEEYFALGGDAASLFFKDDRL